MRKNKKKVPPSPSKENLLEKPTPKRTTQTGEKKTGKHKGRPRASCNQINPRIYRGQRSHRTTESRNKEPTNRGSEGKHP